MNKKRAVVTGGTKEDLAPIAVWVMNIVEMNQGTFDDIIIFHNGINTKQQKLVQKIYPVKFIKYICPIKSKNDVVATYFSTMVFSKYECIHLLEEYDSVTWVDYDTVIKQELNGVLTVNEGFKVLPVEPLREMFYEEIKNKSILKYNLDVPGMNASVFTVSRNMKDYTKVYKWCVEKTKEYDEDIWLPEQCIIGLAIQEFNITVDTLDTHIYNCQPKDEDKANIVILHSIGPVKFWNGIYDKDWEERYQRWLSMGGQKYSDRKKKILRKYLLIKSRILGVRAKAVVSRK